MSEPELNPAPVEPVPSNQPTEPKEGILDTVQEAHVKLRRRDIVEHPLYHRFKHWATYAVAIPLFFNLLVLIGYCLGGGFSSNTCSQNTPETPKSATALTGTTGTVVPILELRPLISALEKAAESKPSTPPPAEPPKKRSKSPVSQVENCPCPQDRTVQTAPQPQLMPPPVPIPQPEKPTDPMAGMTPEQRCNYQIVTLRKARCQ